MTHNSVTNSFTSHREVRFNGESVDLNLHLDELNYKKPELLRKLKILLSKEGLVEQVVSNAQKRGILCLNSYQKSKIMKGGADHLMFHLFSLKCSLKQLVVCLEGKSFAEVRAVLGLCEKLSVVKQPSESRERLVELGSELLLEFVVDGTPPPRYQWYLDDEPLDGSTQGLLRRDSFRETDEGTYHCVASQRIHNCVSQVSSVRVECSLLVWVPCFVVDLPSVVEVEEFSSVCLEVEVECPSSVTYEWLRDNEIISTEPNFLKIDDVSVKDEGKYRCVVKNRGGTIYSNMCKLVVKQNRPSVKLALLIGNNESANFSELASCENDVVKVGEVLMKIGWWVMPVINLTGEETRRVVERFSRLVPPAAYVLFYYSGHGFELSNNKFMMPTDCPPSGRYLLADCVSDQYVVQRLVERSPKLLVTVLDMCLKDPDRELNPQLYEGGAARIPHHDYDCSSCSMVQACATSDYQPSYEHRNKRNTSYCQCLCKNLLRDEPVKKLLEATHEEFVSKKNNNQNPSLSTNDYKSYKLTCEPLGHTPVDTLISELGTVRTNRHKIVFKKTGFSAQVLVVPFMNIVLNALVFKFSPEMTQKDFRFSCQLFSCNIPRETNVSKSHMITVRNVQKLTGQIRFLIEELAINEEGEEIVSDSSEIILNKSLLTSDALNCQ